jgi:hypothetical protein
MGKFKAEVHSSELVLVSFTFVWAHFQMSTPTTSGMCVGLRGQCVFEAFVRLGNKLMRVTSLIAFLGMLVGCITVIEQPVQSCMFKLKPLALVIKFCNLRRI